MFRVSGSNLGNSPLFNVPSSMAALVRKTGADDFLNSENDKNDYDWYILFIFLTVFLMLNFCVFTVIIQCNYVI